MKLAIIGSRTFTDKEGLFNAVDKYIYSSEEYNLNPPLFIKYLEIVSGGARGADTLAKQYALKNNFLYKEFPADWNTLGKSAGFIRNKFIAEYADRCLAFVDKDIEKSKGTNNTIRWFQIFKKPYKIYQIFTNGMWLTWD